MRFAAALILATTLRAQPVAPAAIDAETGRLAFHAVPLISKGSLEDQLRGSVESLRKAAKGGRVVKVRVFSAVGSERIASILAEVFTRARLPLPVVNVIPVGALPGEGAQVLVEGVSESKTVENPNGLAFISGQLTQAPLDPAHPRAPVTPLAEKSVANLKTILGSFQLEAASVLRMACFASSLEDHEQVRQLVAQAFPRAQIVLMQVERTPANQLIECEAVARLAGKPGELVRLVNPANAAFAQAALVTAPRIVFTTTAAGSGSGPEADAAAVRQAFTGLKAALEGGGSALNQVFYVSGYPQGNAVLVKYRDVRWEFLDKARAPASTNLSFEGPASAGSNLLLDAMALPR